jgi:autotransporter-associated beta strand protein
MNPETPPTPREKLEMRLTALLMGELPPEEAAAIRTLMAADPALAALHERLRRACELLREASALPEPPAPPTPVQLSSERREKLLAHFKTAAPVSTAPPAPAPIAKLPRRNWTWIVPTGIAAAVIAVLGAGLLLPTFSSVRVRSGSAKMSPDFFSSNGYVNADWSPQPGTTMTIAGALQSTPAPAIFFGGGSASGPGYAGGTFKLITPPSSNPAGLTKSGSGTFVLTPAPPQVTTGINIAGVGVSSEPPVITSSVAGAQQLQKGAVQVDAAKQRLMNLDDFAMLETYTATTGRATENDKLGASGEGPKKPFLGDLNGQGDIVLNGANTYTGGVTITAGATTFQPLVVGQTVSGAPIASDAPITISGTVSGTGGVTLNGSNTFGGATAFAGTLTGAVTLGSGGSNGDAVTISGQSSAAPAPSKPVALAFGNGTVSNSSANMAFDAASDTLNLNVGGIISRNNEGAAAGRDAGDAGQDDRMRYRLRIGNKDTPPANEPFTLAGNGALDSATSSTTGTGKAATDSPLTLNSNIAIGSLSSNTQDNVTLAYHDSSQLFNAKSDAPTGPVRIDYGVPIQIHADPSASPSPGFGVGDVIDSPQAPSPTPARAKLESAAGQATEAERTERYWRAKHLSAGEAATSGPTTTTTGATDGPLTLNSNIATGSLSSNRQDKAAPDAPDKGVEIDSGQLSKTAPVASIPAPTPAPRIPVYAKAQPVAKLDSAKKEQATEEDIRNLYATGNISNFRIFSKPPADAPPSDAVVAEVKKEKDSSKETPRQQPTPPTMPQPEVQTRDNAFSTFSLNVSDVSFKLAAANLEQGRMPDPSSIRSEEFVNAFDYRDPEPAPGAPLAFASERARYPFAQNRDLLRFSVKTAAAGRQPGRPLNIVLLLDKSGSMERADRVNIVREALRVLAAQLQPQDKLSIVTFARTPRLWADGVAGNKAGEMIARVAEITPEGGTNLDAALDLGYATALRHYAVGSISRVVLFTDGAANLGDVDPAALTQKVETHRKEGVALDCFGIGWEGYNDDLLEQLTRNGDGRYGFINTPEEAAANFAAQLAGALQVAASDVKTQVEFNPRRVKAYRQIGYAKHQLTKEQFRDNTVNAAQIGAAESGNALYVVEVDPHGEGDLATVRVRFRVPGTNDYREHEWAVPFNGNAPLLEQSSPALRLAGTASAFSEMLASSPYAAEVTSDHLIGLLNGVPATYGADPRPKKLEWMIRQVKTLSGH